jgi:hypothetical protein
MSDDTTIEFLLCNPLQASAPGSGECSSRRFGGLDVVVTPLNSTSTVAILAAMPGGYMAELDAILRSRGIRLGGTDIAHWILCRDGDQTAVHLAYISADREVPVLMPWDLLSDEERRRGSRIG